MWYSSAYQTWIYSNPAPSPPRPRSSGICYRRSGLRIPGRTRKPRTTGPGNAQLLIPHHANFTRFGFNSLVQKFHILGGFYRKISSSSSSLLLIHYIALFSIHPFSFHPSFLPISFSLFYLDSILLIYSHPFPFHSPFFILTLYFSSTPIPSLPIPFSLFYLDSILLIYSHPFPSHSILPLLILTLYFSSTPIPFLSFPFHSSFFILTLSFSSTPIPSLLIPFSLFLS